MFNEHPKAQWDPRIFSHCCEISNKCNPKLNGTSIFSHCCEVFNEHIPKHNGTSIYSHCSEVFNEHNPKHNGTSIIFSHCCKIFNEHTPKHNGTSKFVSSERLGTEPFTLRSKRGRQLLTTPRFEHAQTYHHDQ